MGSQFGLFRFLDGFVSRISFIWDWISLFGIELYCNVMVFSLIHGCCGMVEINEISNGSVGRNSVHVTYSLRFLQRANKAWQFRCAYLTAQLDGTMSLLYTKHQKFKASRGSSFVFGKSILIYVIPVFIHSLWEILGYFLKIVLFLYTSQAQNES